MITRLRYLFVAAICLFVFTFPAAAASSELNVSAAPANVSAPFPVPMVIPHGEPETVPDASFSNATEPSLVQIAADNFPHEELFTKKWKGEATIEIYLVSDVVNTVGNVTGSALYGTIYQILDEQCPPQIGVKDHPTCYLSSQSFPIRYRKDGGNTAESLNQIQVMSSKFANNEVRRPLIGALASAYEAMTQYDRNCFRANDPGAGYRHCNVAIRAKAFTEDSWISMQLTSDIDDDNDGSWHCCETRELIDAKLDDGVVKEFKGIYTTQRGKGRLVECHLGCSADQRAYKIDVDKALIDVINVEKW